MELHGWFEEQLQQAFLDAFLSSMELQQFVRFKLNQNLNAIAGGNDLSDKIFQLIRWVKSRGQAQFTKLIDGACEYNPGNENLQAVQQLFHKTINKIQYILVLSISANNFPTDQAEDLIDDLSKLLKDPCLNLNNIESGSTRLNLIGSEESFKQLQARLNSEELTEISGYSIEALEDNFGQTIFRRFIPIQYTLVLSDSLDKNKEPQIEAIIQDLSQLLGDKHLKRKSIEPGSTKLILEGSQEGFEKLQTLLISGNLLEISGFDIEALDDAYGKRIFIKTIPIKERIENLRQLLEKHEWEEADRETSNILIQAARPENRDWLQEEDIQNISCDILLKIDKLWREHSDDCFGLSIQKGIWEEAKQQSTDNFSAEKEFGKQVHWYGEEKRDQWLWRFEINPLWGINQRIKGYLPTPPPTREHKDAIKVWVIDALAQKLSECEA